MSQTELAPREARGPISYMAGNPVAANLFMLVIVAAGLVALTGIEREAWPVFPFNQIEVSVPYPGASPDEVEEGIVVKIEEQVTSLEAVKAVNSTAAPGMASVRLEVKSGFDMREALDDVESAVARIRTFPGGAERPEIREMTNAQSLMRLIVHGDVPERSLKELAYQIEDELAALPGVSLVESSGVRDYEVSVEVSTQRLRALGLRLQDVAQALRRNSADVSAGQMETHNGVVRVRALGQRYRQQEFEDIVLLSRADGTSVRVRDIATVRDDFAESALIVRHLGQPAAFVEVYRLEDEDVADVASTVHDHLRDAVIPSLPPGVGVTVWNDESRSYSERVDLLLKNGVLGLMLVFAALALFLEVRLALWVGVGLTTTFIGALAVMLALDVSLNTISLFVFVLALGIIVDDAIVVAEHIHHERQSGVPGLAAAIRGARRVSMPVTFAVLTSIAVFTPLFFIPGGIGVQWRPLPIIVIAMLVISLIEALLILPNHLSHLPGPHAEPSNAVDRLFARTREFVDRQLARFVAGPLDRGVGFAADQPAVVIAGAIAMLILSLSLIPAGIVKTTFADVIQGDFVTASLEMPEGTTADRTYKIAAELERTGHRVLERLSASRPDDAPPLLSGVTVTVGQRQRFEGGGVLAAPTLNPEGNIATVEFRLSSARDRDISTVAVADAWRDSVGAVPSARGLMFSGEVIDYGSAVQVALSHPDPDRLLALGAEVVDGLRGVAGVHEVRSDHAEGVREIQLRLRPEARTLGLSFDDVATQMRAGLFGAEALRVQRGREEVKVLARLPADERDAITDVERFWISTPGELNVPLVHVADVSMGTAPPTISRRDGKRVLTVTAEVDPATISAADANAILTDSILAGIVARDPELTYTYGGEQMAQMESLGALYRGFALAMLMIFVLLAIPLRSYTKPFLVMAIIPFGLIGVILGHLVLNVPVSATTVMGVLGLSGVLVNDSLVMIDFIDQRLSEGASLRAAILEGAKGRFRPIMLTSVTTFLAFTPLILERAIEAQFLLPFAASLGVGILVTTVILMLVVPALAALQLRGKAGA